MKPIETIYKGFRFRSRLEARWAVFYDVLGIKWEYEKEGFDLGNGILYLPDFYIPDLNCWIEIKGEYPGEKDENKIEKLAQFTNKNTYYFVGQIEQPETPLLDKSGYCFFAEGGWDSHQWWCQCTHCGKIGIEWCGIESRICGEGRENYSERYNARSQKLIKAYLAARQARFEHGE